MSIVLSLAIAPPSLAATPDGPSPQPSPSASPRPLPAASPAPASPAAGQGQGPRAPRIGSGLLPWWAYGTAGVVGLGGGMLLGLGSSVLTPRVGVVPNAGSNLLQMGAVASWLALPPFAMVGALEGLPPPGGPWASATTGGVVGILGGFLAARALGQLPAAGEGLGLGALGLLSAGQTLGALGGYGLWVALSPQTQGLNELAPMELAPDPFWLPWRLRDNPLNW